MLNAISTLGITVGYCVETTAGTRPSGGFTTIAEIRDIPEIGNIPDALDATPLEETIMKRYPNGTLRCQGELRGSEAILHR